MIWISGIVYTYDYGMLILMGMCDVALVEKWYSGETLTRVTSSHDKISLRDTTKIMYLDSVVSAIDSTMGTRLDTLNSSLIPVGMTFWTN